MLTTISLVILFLAVPVCVKLHTFSILSILPRVCVCLSKNSSFAPCYGWCMHVHVRFPSSNLCNPEAMFSFWEKLPFLLNGVIGRVGRLPLPCMAVLYLRKASILARTLEMALEKDCSCNLASPWSPWHVCYNVGLAADNVMYSSWEDVKLSREPASPGSNPGPAERHLSSFIRAAR
jgi:hypothetical protein